MKITIIKTRYLCLVLLWFLSALCYSRATAQTGDAASDSMFLLLYENPHIDYNLSFDNSKDFKRGSFKIVSPYIAAKIFRMQKKHVAIQDRVLYWCDTPIFLFETVAEIRRKFPELPGPDSNYWSIAPGVSLYFTTFQNEQYLTGYTISIGSLYDPNPEKWQLGIFMIDSFPISSMYFNDREFSEALKVYNERSDDDFSKYYLAGYYITKDRDIAPPHPGIMDAYFRSNEKYAKATHKHYLQRLVWHKYTHSITCDLSYTGSFPLDEQSLPEAPSGAGSYVTAPEGVLPAVDVEASFPGGKDSLYSYIVRNLKYPEEAMASKIEGKVFVEFIIEKDGYITNIVIKKGLPGGCNEEVIRVLKKMPKWIPAKEKDRFVRSIYRLPIVFRLE